jgi:hypothetical protein
MNPIGPLHAKKVSHQQKNVLDSCMGITAVMEDMEKMKITCLYPDFNPGPSRQ